MAQGKVPNVLRQRIEQVGSYMSVHARSALQSSCAQAFQQPSTGFFTVFGKHFDIYLFYQIPGDPA
jgi:hypothetical protein